MRKLIIATLTLLTLPALAADLPIRPDPKLTPGAVLTTDATKICVKGYAKTVRHTSGALKAEIYREYGISRTDGHFEIDHLISLGLGGADVKENLWPESFDTQPWNAHVKDKLEDRLHAMVCAGQIKLEEAQHAVSSDWIAAYQKYVGPVEQQAKQ
jgi:hypothetical protein